MNMKEVHYIQGIVPVADAFAGTVTTDIFEVLGQGAWFMLVKGAGAAGLSVITVLACDDTTPSNTTAIPFTYRVQTTSDTWGAWTQATTTGFTTSAGADQLYEIYADSAYLAETGYGYVKLVAIESNDDPVTGCVICGVTQLRYAVQPESLID